MGTKTKYRIGHWYGYEPPVPEAIKTAEKTEKYAATYEIEIDDLHEFVKTHGEIKLVPPGRYGDVWFIGLQIMVGGIPVMGLLC